MLVGSANAAVHTCDEGAEFGKMLHLAAAASQRDGSVQFVFAARKLQFVLNLFENELHTAVYDSGEGLAADFARRLVADSGDGYDLVFVGVGGKA